jgi:hypothetical protein
MHLSSLNLQHNRLTVTLADFDRRINISREMHVMPSAFDQSLLFD